MKFEGIKQTFRVKFGEIFNVSDDSYDRGYKEGYDQGYDKGYKVGFAEGETKGQADGYKQGYDAGLVVGENNGYNKGYEAGYEAGYAKGKADGYAEGHTAGYSEGHTEGYSEGETAGYGKGFDAGHGEGYTEGETAGYNNGYDVGVIDGKQAEYDAFWNLKQQSKGAPQSYTADFGGRWTVDAFNPKYDIIPTSAPYMFCGNNLQIDLVEHLKKIGKKLDFSQCSNQNFCFFMSSFTHIGNACALGRYNSVFQDCTHLVTIDEWGDAQGREMSANGLTSTFNNCTALENITIKGKFANTVYFHWCTKLTHDSLMSIINALCDNGSGKTLQIGSTNMAKLTDEELDIAYEKGWTVI